MNDSIQLANGSSVIDCAYVQTAQRRFEQMRTSKPYSLEPPTMLELEKALGEGVQKCELLGKNWRNRVYRLDLDSGARALAKQVIVGTEATVQYQYEQLQALSKLQIPGLRIPKPLGLVDAKRTFVMEFATGKTIGALVWNDTREHDLLSACELAGKILARIHIAWTKEVAAMPVKLLASDFAAAPWHLSSREQRILDSALKVLSQAEVSTGQIYYDYKPANLLFENNELFLIDPPEMPWLGIHLWDFSRFRGDMRRALWRLSLRRPFHRRYGVVRQSMARFERAYVESFIKRHPDPGLFAPATRLFELQHTALSMTMHKEKTKAKISTLPLLELEKRWLFHRLARELP
jgi:hypothetical protein